MPLCPCGVVLAELLIASAVCPERLPPLLFENLHVAKNKRPISLHLAKPVGVRVGVSYPEYCSPTFHATRFLLTFTSGWTNLLAGFTMLNLTFLYNIGPWRLHPPLRYAPSVGLKHDTNEHFLTLGLTWIPKMGGWLLYYTNTANFYPFSQHFHDLFDLSWPLNDLLVLMNQNMCILKKCR